jgi:excisionase family DNA binding protein
MSVAEAAAYWGVRPVTVRKWLRGRRIPFHRLGRRIVLDRRDVEDFFNRHPIEAE